MGIAQIKPPDDPNTSPFYEGGIADENIDTYLLRFKTNLLSHLNADFIEQGYCVTKYTKRIRESLCDIVQDSIQIGTTIKDNPKLSRFLDRYKKDEFREHVMRYLEVAVIVYNWILPEIKTKNSLNEPNDKPYGGAIV
ncbi:MAG: hypothetical protein PHT54_00755 [Candidatus Nanoarchaeia archaeon]|nr:hypothetical protein [Candidatus Nanoarchaeia archaeon]